MIHADGLFVRKFVYIYLFGLCVMSIYNYCCDSKTKVEYFAVYVGVGIVFHLRFVYAEYKDNFRNEYKDNLTLDETI